MRIRSVSACRKIWLLCTLLITGAIHAQTYVDVIYAKSGSIVKGVIIETVPNISYKIKTNDGNIFVFKAEEIEKIEKLETSKQKAKTEPALGKRSGFSSIEEIGASLILNETTNTPLFALHSINGYLFNPHLFAGVGVGIEADDITAVIPIYAECRAYVSKGKASPYFAAGGGYGLMYINQGKNDGGPMGHVLAGLKITLGPKAAFNVSAGYRLFQFKQTGLVYNKTLYKYTPAPVEYNSSNLFLRIGCTF